MTRVLPVLVAFLVLPSWNASACSTNYYRDGSFYLNMPTAMFDIECRVILENHHPWEFNPEGWTSSVEKHKRTVEVDLEEFSMAVRGQQDADSIVADYAVLREALKVHVAKWLSRMDSALRDYGTLERLAQSRRADMVKRPEPFDLAPFENTLSRLPEEFGEYIRGAVAYHAGDWDAALEHFGVVLELPEEQRQYRSTWAAFMLGKTYIQSEPSKAGEYFELTRTLAQDGFRDSLELAEASHGWQAHSEMQAGRYVQAIHRYAAINDNFASESLRFVCRRALSAEPIDGALVDDELARRIVTAWVMSHPSEEALAEKWLATLERFRPKGIVEHADRLAWFSYQRGAMDVAERWLEQCDPGAPYGRWVRAKLLLRAGELGAGAALLKELANEFPEDHQWRVQSPVHGTYLWDPVYARDEVRMDLGATLVQQEDYSGALEAFCGVPDRYAVYLAERIMTLEELMAYVDSPPEDLSPNRDDRFMPRYAGYNHPPDVRNLLARRLVREGRWEEAIHYFWDNTYLRRRAFDMKEHLAVVQDDTQPVAERAHSLFELGRIVREDGPELLSPELIPYLPEGDVRGPSSDYERRDWDSQKCYPKMNYYRYIAADYMWRAAELLPDNDVLTAHALYLGGTYLKDKDPDAADRFYKALVRRNPNLLVARQADELRWFPKEFTDVVLYQPLPQRHWYQRKRNIALAVLSGSAGLVLLFWTARISSKKISKGARASRQ